MHVLVVSETVIITFYFQQQILITTNKGVRALLVFVCISIALAFPI